MAETVAGEFELDFSMVRFPKFAPDYVELYSKVLSRCPFYLSLKIPHSCRVSISNVPKMKELQHI